MIKQASAFCGCFFIGKNAFIKKGRYGLKFKGSSAYDQEDFLAAYLSRRNREESPNNAIEKPILDELFGDYRGTDILDLGCGDGSFGKELLDGGAKSYTGIEASKQMKMHAEKILANTAGAIYQADIGAVAYPEKAYDIVTSRFVIHYLPNINTLFEKIHKTLKPGGRFIFTVQHPLTTSSFKSKEEGDKRTDWRVDDYFIEGERLEPWINKTVVKHHRTMESYFTALIAAGFTVKAVREGMPAQIHFRSEEEFKRRQRIPLMLIFSATK